MNSKNKSEARTVSEAIENKNSANGNDDIAYEVDQILEMKFIRNKRKFLVSWRGYPASANTWEPEENLEGARDLIKEFMEEYDKERNKRVSGRKRKTTSDSRPTSSTPASSTPQKLMLSDKEEQGKNDDIEASVPKKRGRRPMQAIKDTPVIAKKESKTADDEEKELPTKQNARKTIRLTDGSGSDGADENQNKKKSQSENATLPILPDIPNDAKAKSPFTLKLEDDDVDSKETKDEQFKAVKGKPTTSEQATSSSVDEGLKIVGFTRAKNSDKLMVIVEGSEKKHELYSIEAAIKTDAVALARFAVAKLDSVRRNLYIN